MRKAVVFRSPNYSESSADRGRASKQFGINTYPSRIAVFYSACWFGLVCDHPVHCSIIL